MASHTFPSQATTLRPEAWGWHLFGLINPLVVIAGNLLGGWCTAAGVVYMLGIGPVLDVVLGKSDCRKRSSRDSGQLFEVMLFAHALLQLLAVGTLLFLATSESPVWTIVVAAVSTGIK